VGAGLWLPLCFSVGRVIGALCASLLFLVGWAWLGGVSLVELGGASAPSAWSLPFARQRRTVRAATFGQDVGSAVTLSARGPDIWPGVWVDLERTLGSGAIMCRLGARTLTQLRGWESRKGASGA